VADQSAHAELGAFHSHDELDRSTQLVVGAGLRTDPGVLLGYQAERAIADRRLIIGADAHIRSGSVIYEGCRIGDRLNTGHNVVIREENLLGDDVSVWSGSVIDYGCHIGHRVKIHTNCYIAQFSVLADDVFLAPGVSLANDIHPGCAFSARCMRGPTLEQGVQVGVNVTILPYVRVGAYSLLGAGAVVTADVPPRSVVVGNPGRVIRTLDQLRCSTGLTDVPYPASYPAHSQAAPSP
jgi:acetyltransferase-like isoleucine patch superfamily enzyme